MNNIISELFNTESEALFNLAQKIGNSKIPLTCSPNILVGNCTTRPICRHCKWEYMKSRNNEFYIKRSLEEIISRTKILEKSGINRVFAASGWMGFKVPKYFYEYINAMKENSTMEVFGLFGAIGRESLTGLKDAGMDGYFCGLESPNEQLYKLFRPGGDTMRDRIVSLNTAKNIGLKLWSGFLVGFGESEEDVSGGLEILKELNVDSISILPFIPVTNTEMMREDPANPFWWAKVMAVARIYNDKPDMFSDQKEGLYSSYSQLAGANGFYIFPK